MVTQSKASTPVEATKSVLNTLEVSVVDTKDNSILDDKGWLDSVYSVIGFFLDFSFYIMLAIVITAIMRN